MVREQTDGGLFGPKIKPESSETSGPRYMSKIADELPLDWEDVVMEQECVAKLVHLLEVVADDGSIGEAELDSEFMASRIDINNNVIAFECSTQAFWRRRACSD